MRLLTLLHHFLTTLKGFTLLLILFLILSIGYAIFSLQQMRNETRYFANITMLDLLAQWNENLFFIATTQELREHLTDEQLQRLDMVFTQLGELLNYHGIKGGLYRSSDSWLHIAARYKVQASFQGGQFVAIITLVKEKGHWKIGRFDYQYAFFTIKKQPGSVIVASLRLNRGNYL
jgi:hypothetical protein